jgi:hypothetical protein
MAGRGARSSPDRRRALSIDDAGAGLPSVRNPRRGRNMWEEEEGRTRDLLEMWAEFEEGARHVGREGGRGCEISWNGEQNQAGAQRVVWDGWQNPRMARRGRRGLDCDGRGSGHRRGKASNPGSLSTTDAAQGSGRGRLRRGAREAGQRSRTASARGEGSRAAVADGFGAGRGKQGSGRGRLRRGERKAGQRSRTASGDGGGDTTLAGAGLQGGNGAGGGWRGGTVRVVDLDALAPALRCSRDNIVSKDKVISHSSNSTT